MKNIYDLTLKELIHQLSSFENPVAKAQAIFHAIYREGKRSWDILPFSTAATQQLSQKFHFNLPTLVNIAKDQNACKLLLCLSDHTYIETVLMQQAYGNSVCISTQVGCNMGCAFCQSGLHKKERNLTAGEMVAQLIFLQDMGYKISTVAIMGIGEPFDNYENVMRFIAIISSDHGMAIGMRHITISTCGMVPSIMKYSLQKPTNSLAISLHAPTDELRNFLMPINKTYPLSQLMDAIAYYTKSTKRKVFLEYIMLSHVNDEPSHAKALAKLVKGLACKINLIPYNQTSSLPFERSSFERMMIFYDILKQENISVTIRREFGKDVKAACGQLQAEHDLSTH